MQLNNHAWCNNNHRGETIEMEKERVEENKTQNVRRSQYISGDPPPLPLLPSHALIFVRAELDNKALQLLQDRF